MGGRGNNAVFVRVLDLEDIFDVHSLLKRFYLDNRSLDSPGSFSWFFCPRSQDMSRAHPAAADNFAATLAKKNIAAAKPERTNEKLYTENMLNGGHINQNMQQFMEKDRKVCRFFAVVDDLQTAQYERRPFLIYYYLADNTIQIREQYPLNCGRDGFALFCKRMRMPKGATELRGPMDSAYQEEDYVQVTDLVVGGRVDVYSMNFFIYDADQFTRDYFEKDLKSPLVEKVVLLLGRGKCANCGKLRLMWWLRFICSRRRFLCGVSVFHVRYCVSVYSEAATNMYHTLVCRFCRRS